MTDEQPQAVKNRVKTKRDQQLYCTWEDVESVWNYLRQSNALRNLKESDWNKNSEEALEELFCLDDKSSCQLKESTEYLSIVHPEVMNNWATTYLSRDAWRKVKKAYARFKYNQKNRIYKIDLKDHTRLQLLAIKDELGFASYDEVLQYQHQQILELKQQLTELQDRAGQTSAVLTEAHQQETKPTIHHQSIHLHDKQQLQDQVTYLTDEFLTQYLLERLPNDYRSALTVVVKNLFCEGYLQAKADKLRSVRKMQEHLDTNDYLKQLNVD